MTSKFISFGKRRSAQLWSAFVCLSPIKTIGKRAQKFIRLVALAILLLSGSTIVWNMLDRPWYGEINGVRFTRQDLERTLRLRIDKWSGCAPQAERSGRHQPLNAHLMIVCFSSIHNWQARNAIRETWGKEAHSLGVPVYFLIGSLSTSTNARSDEHQDRYRVALQQSVQAEDRVYGDLLQTHFGDTYQNLSLKSIALMSWIERQHCERAIRFVLKTDDDAIVNVARLLHFARHSSSACSGPCFVGRLVYWTPVRDVYSKYYCPPFIYAPDYFPPFVTGPGYLFTPNVARPIVELAMRRANETLFLEDVYVTGVLAQQLLIERTNHDAFFNNVTQLNAHNFARVWITHQWTPDQLRRTWEQVNE